MNKPLRPLCLLLCALLLVLAPSAALAEYNYEGLLTPNIIVIDAGDLTASNPIYERAADTKLYPASTTKILTCIVALENSSLDTQVTVGEEIKGLYELKNGYTENSSLMGLVQGETLSLRDLLYGLMLVSGNEAADAIAVAVGGTIENFVSMMNAKAAELGMSNSHFMNPNGVHSDEHYSTARDMAKLTAYALNNRDFAAIVRTGVYTVPANSVRQNELKLVNSNLLITAEDSPQYDSYPYAHCIGVKTGLTTKAGSCLIAAAEKDGARAIVCLYGDPIDTKSEQLQRFTNARGIFEDLFANVYTTVSGEALNLQTTFSCTIQRGRPEDLDENGQLTLTADISQLSIRGLPSELEQMQANPAAITTEIAWADSLAAPIRQGQWLGTVSYLYNGREIFSLELTAPKDVLEVAVLSPTNDASAPGDSDGQTTGGLLTEPTQSQPVKKGMSPFLVVLLVLLGILVVVVIVSALIAAQKRKRRRLRQQRRMQQQQQRRVQKTRPSGSAYGQAYGRGGSGGGARRDGTAAAERRSPSRQPSARNDGQAGARPAQRSGSGQAPQRTRSAQEQPRRRP